MSKENLVETIKYRGYKIDCFYDTDAESPDNWGNDDVFVVYDHRDFCVERKGFDPEEIFETYQKNKKVYDGHWFFPVYAYIHSGVALSLGRNRYPFNDRWDVSMKGFALVKIQKGWTWTEDKAYKVAQSEIETWNEYLSGEVYGYNSKFGSCWGFYGDEGYKEIVANAKSEIDYAIREKRKKHFEYLKTMIRNHVPINERKNFKLKLTM